MWFLFFTTISIFLLVFATITILFLISKTTNTPYLAPTMIALIIFALAILIPSTLVKLTFLIKIYLALISYLAMLGI